MNKDLKCEKDELSLETLDKVTGGTGESISPDSDENINENDITKVPDLVNPHSKKAKSKLYKWS